MFYVEEIQMTSNNNNQLLLRSAVKMKINQLINDSNLSITKIYNDINLKYNCDLNKDTFRKTISYTDNTFNIYCLIYLCQYFNIDMNSLFDISNKSPSINQTEFPFSCGEYTVYLRNPYLYQKHSCKGRLIVSNISSNNFEIKLYLNAHSIDKFEEFVTKDVYITPKKHIFLTFSNIYQKEFILHLSPEPTHPHDYIFSTGFMFSHLNSEFLSKVIITNKECKKDYDQYFYSLLKIENRFIRITKTDLEILSTEDSDIEHALKIVRYSCHICSIDDIFPNEYLIDTSIYNHILNQTKSIVYIPFGKSDDQIKKPIRVKRQAFLRGLLKLFYYSSNTQKIELDNSKLLNAFKDHFLYDCLE